MTRESLVEMLLNNVVKVTFIKKDASKRVMKCTLQSDFLPELKGSNSKRSTKVIPVWELENGWRSFRVESVIDAEILSERN